jgi:predicted phosphodiesterase
MDTLVYYHGDKKLPGLALLHRSNPICLLIGNLDGELLQNQNAQCSKSNITARDEVRTYLLHGHDNFDCV